MKTILVLTRDLFFGGKIRAAVQNLPVEGEGGGWQGLFVRSEADYRTQLSAGQIDLALLDLQATQFDIYQLISETHQQGVPVLAFGRHTDPQSLRKARQLGAVRAVPNSTLVEKFPLLLAQATNPTLPPVPVEQDLE